MKINLSRILCKTLELIKFAVAPTPAFVSEKIKRRLLRRNYYMLRMAALHVERQVILPIPVQKLNLR